MSIEKVPKRSLEVFSHILNAHHIWNKRLLDEDWQYEVWQVHEVNHWEDIHYENQRTTFEIITNTDDFTKRVDYKTTEGRIFANELKDILFHIINHSTNHRGQIATEFRKNKLGLEPLDYIFYKR
ncbi:MAG: DinB family protein [Bacteroidota bacterium]